MAVEFKFRLPWNVMNSIKHKKCCRLKCESCVHCFVHVCFVFIEVCPSLVAKLRDVADAMLT